MFGDISKVHLTLVVGFLIGQLALCVAFGPEGWQVFRWSMYARVWNYEVAVKIDGKSLSEEEIKARYKIRKSGATRSPKHLKAHIVRFEEYYGDIGKAEVVAKMIINKGREKLITIL